MSNIQEAYNKFNADYQNIINFHKKVNFKDKNDLSNFLKKDFEYFEDTFGKGIDRINENFKEYLKRNEEFDLKLLRKMITFDLLDLSIDFRFYATSIYDNLEEDSSIWDKKGYLNLLKVFADDIVELDKLFWL